MTKKTLVNESVVRRWGKLANMAPLTENWLDNIQEEEELEMGAEELEADGGEEEIMSAEVEVEGEPEVPLSEEEAEALVSAIADAITTVTGQQVDSESDADAEDLVDAGEDLEAAGADLEALADEEAPMGAEPAYNRTDEELGIDVIDDDQLTEAVLKRVVERLLSNK